MARYDAAADLAGALLPATRQGRKQLVREATRGLPPVARLSLSGVLGFLVTWLPVVLKFVLLFAASGPKATAGTLGAADALALTASVEDLEAVRRIREADGGGGVENDS